MRYTATMDHRRPVKALNGRPYDPSLDFDTDFSKLNNPRRRRNRSKKLKNKDVGAVQSLLTGIDQDDDAHGEEKSSKFSVTKSAVSLSSSVVPKPCSPTTGTLRIGALRCWSSAGKHDPEGDDEARQQRILTRHRDDYQSDPREIGYSKLERLSSIVEDSEKIFQREEDDSPKEETQDYERPPDPPDIPPALVGLSFTDFEAKAKERATTIVTAWLHDSGLIDELLVNGGMSRLTPGSLRRGIAVNRGRSSSVASATTASSDGDPSVKSSEGVEIGAHGFPIEGASKMDKEMTRLRFRIQRQVAMIDSQLSDGKVVPTGGEVQDFVNAISAINKDEDLGKLRELSTYISNARGEAERSSQILPPGYPRLSKAINAQRNLQRSFRELDFYSLMKVSCDRLREELFSSERTAQEWIVVRNVAREHAEMETFLIEAETGMKRRMDERHSHDKDDKSRYRPTTTHPLGSSRPPRSMLYHYKAVDMFLSDKVKTVWGLGKDIRLRIANGIGTAFQMAMSNPLGIETLKPLVEAVEIYETANDDFKSLHGGVMGHSNQILRFTSMRAAALKHIYQDFERRGSRVFQRFRKNVERNTEEENKAHAIFSVVLQAAHGLTEEIGIFQSQMTTYFPPQWALDVLWSTCIAHVCSKQILEQIGGPDGHRLSVLTVTELLDLVAWVEHFRETIEKAFPNIGAYSFKTNYFDERPELLIENTEEIDMDLAMDSLVWANNMLWQVHDLAKDEFLLRTKEQSEEWLGAVYESEHTHNQTSEGRLITSLCEDVFSLAGVQLRTIRDRVTHRSEALVQAVGVIFKKLYEKQIEGRDRFLSELELCCAASNDFIRMSENCEDILAEILAVCNLRPGVAEALEEQTSILLDLYTKDAVFAAQKVHVYIFEPIEESISEGLFGEEWLNEWTSNELALTLVRTLEDYIGDLKVFLDEVMVAKAIDALVTSAILFYIKCLLRKADKHKQTRRPIWSNSERALGRMMGDIRVMKDYFRSLIPSFSSLHHTLDTEFEILETIHELLSIATGNSSSTFQDFVLLLQKRIRNIPITKLVVGDLWHLVRPTEERAICDILDDMEEELRELAPTEESAMESAKERNAVPGLRVDQAIAMVCDKSKRIRPLKEAALEQTKKMMRRWRATWIDLVKPDLPY